MFIKIKKSLSICLITVMLLVYILPIGSVFAEESIAPTPSPTETPVEIQIDNSATSNTDSTTVSDTGNNAIGEIPTPTPEQTTETQLPVDTPIDTVTPTPDLLPTPEESITISNSGDVISDINSIANSGENNISTSSATQIDNSTDSSQDQLQDNFVNNPDNSNSNSENSIETGNAVSSTNIENEINTASVNSNTIYQTINILVDEDADINLSDPLTIASFVLTQRPNDPIITVTATSINNIAFVSNDIISSANTGKNIISSDPSQNSSINTGDAYSIVSLLNKVNMVVINSTVHIVSINIYGDLNGNIILPDMNTSTNCQTCGISLMTGNNATVENNVNSVANTGQNSIAASGSAVITTGDANSQVNLLNIVNTNMVGVNIQGLYINVLGDWNGNFIGWGDINPQDDSASLALTNITSGTGSQSCSTCTGDIYIKNDALVLNNISSSANTGQNAINGGNSNIKTGNANSVISIINFINSNFINSFGFIGFINIFGRLNGDIGGKTEFAKLETETSQEVQTTIVNESSNVDEGSKSSEPEKRQDGGKLEVTTSNNTGAYVLPGDTVTFFVNVKNTGTGKVYEAKLNLFLIKDGIKVGGTTFDLDAIDPGKTVKITTGFVLAKGTPGGEYMARAYAEGLVGEENSLISAYADSNFKVLGKNLARLNTDGEKTNKAVLGTKTKPDTVARTKDDLVQKMYLLFALTAYTGVKVIRKRKTVVELFSKSLPVKVRLHTLRTIFI